MLPAFTSAADAGAARVFDGSRFGAQLHSLLGVGGHGWRKCGRQAERRLHQRRAAACGPSRALDGSSPCWLLSLSSHMVGGNLANASPTPPAKTLIHHETPSRRVERGRARKKVGQKKKTQKKTKTEAS